MSVAKVMLILGGCGIELTIILSVLISAFLFEYGLYHSSEINAIAYGKIFTFTYS